MVISRSEYKNYDFCPFKPFLYRYFCFLLILVLHVCCSGPAHFMWRGSNLMLTADCSLSLSLSLADVTAAATYASLSTTRAFPTQDNFILLYSCLFSLTLAIEASNLVATWGKVYLKLEVEFIVVLKCCPCFCCLICLNRIMNFLQKISLRVLHSATRERRPRCHLLWL